MTPEHRQGVDAERTRVERICRATIARESKAIAVLSEPGDSGFGLGAAVGARDVALEILGLLGVEPEETL